jgi:hypothetical protein
VVVAMLKFFLCFCESRQGGDTGLLSVFPIACDVGENITFGGGSVNKNPLYGGRFLADHHILCFQISIGQQFSVVFPCFRTSFADSVTSSAFRKPQRFQQ